MADSDSDDVEMEEVAGGTPGPSHTTANGIGPDTAQLDDGIDEEEDSDEEMEWDEVVHQQPADTSGLDLDTTAEHSLEDSRQLHEDDEDGAEQTENGKGYRGVKIGDADAGPINIVLEQVKKGKKLKCARASRLRR